MGVVVAAYFVVVGFACSAGQACWASVDAAFQYLVAVAVVVALDAAWPSLPDGIASSVVVGIASGFRISFAVVADGEVVGDGSFLLYASHSEVHFHRKADTCFAAALALTVVDSGDFVVGLAVGEVVVAAAFETAAVVAVAES